MKHWVPNEVVAACYSRLNRPFWDMEVELRWLLVLLFVFAALWYWRGVEETPPPKAVDSIIGGPVKALRKAQGFEKSYLDASDERKKRMEEQLEKDAGGP